MSKRTKKNSTLIRSTTKGVSVPGFLENDFMINNNRHSHRHKEVRSNSFVFVDHSAGFNLLAGIRSNEAVQKMMKPKL